MRRESGEDRLLSSRLFVISRELFVAVDHIDVNGFRVPLTFVFETVQNNQVWRAFPLDGQTNGSEENRQHIRTVLIIKRVFDVVLHRILEFENSARPSSANRWVSET